MFLPQKTLLLRLALLPLMACAASVADPASGALQAQYPGAQILTQWRIEAPAHTASPLTGLLLEAAPGAPRHIVYVQENRILSEEESQALGLVTLPTTADTVSQATEFRSGIPARKEAPKPLLRALAPSPEALVLASLDLADIMEEDQRRQKSDPKDVRIGVENPMSGPITLQGAAASIGNWASLDDGSAVWAITIQSPEAEGLRLNIDRLNLPPGAHVVLFNAVDPAEYYGPFIEVDARDGTLWTPSCFSDTVRVECWVPRATDIAQVDLSISQVMHLYFNAAEIGEKAAGACNNDITCPEFSDWQAIGKGICGLGGISGSDAFFCTATLIVDGDTCTGIPYVLAANHCVSGQSGSHGAGNLEFYWEYETPTCNGTPPAQSSVPRTLGGADYLAGSGGTGEDGGGNDFTLMRLRNDPPANIPFIGWTTQVPAVGAAMVDIHHPSRTFKRISFGERTNSGNVHSGLYHQVVWNDGTTEGGSSGSPLFNAATQQIIGQLWGGTASCALQGDPDYFGRFDVTYNAIRPLIAPYMGLSSASYVANEGQGSVTITVNLSKASESASVAINYAVSGVTAQDGIDFTAVSGVLNFTNGQVSKTFSIPILDNSSLDASRTALISLSGPVCFALNAAASSATLTIQNDDADTDGDGISDDDELSGVFGAVTDPNLADTDNDGLSDGQELFATFGSLTNPLDPDSDDDGLSDGTEINFGLDPLDSGDGDEVSTLRVPIFAREKE
ncbi:MAG: hypothetical protein HYV27_00685 [Candidatus Hydrogenedentes bacterium]|nr:hypothetical protein [Candidatus Hydrogenedentota bacterium]